MVPIDPRDPLAQRTLSRGRSYLYVLPCAYEDLLKLGFSRDPLERLQSLHRRWYELFDLERALLVETDTVREARELELRLQHQIAPHNAPAPLTVQGEAGGGSEWYRGAYAHLAQAIGALGEAGYLVHVPARSWLQQALATRVDLIYTWSLAMLTVDELEGRVSASPQQWSVRDALDAYAALDIPLEERLPEAVKRWYRAGGGLR